MSCVNTASASANTSTYRTTSSSAGAYTSTPRQGNVQIQACNSFPGSVQTSSLQYRNGAAAPMNNQFYNSQNNGPPAGNGLMSVAVQGFVDGAAQQIAQNFVQGLMGGDSNNGGDNGGGE
ncbi:hypothetical protein V6N13_127332 [Hibiscus sabdariffa]|uniref:Uncharacterized protein n=1 Tax=Hibiscus sabdariffa TaxID=183260 RepID=A0ABR2RCV3_9ROSI